MQIIRYWIYKLEVFFLDVLDHTIQVIDTIETYREINFSLRFATQYYFLRMNRVVKTLTIISTYFIPVTFIVGIYGMNFRYMPELNLRYGYLFVWILMILVVIGLTVYFRRKKWF